MEMRILGPTGVAIPVIGQGTWKMEGAPADSIRALRRGIELGLTHIDTAQMYGSGEVEAIVGKAIQGQRENIFLTSKVLPSNGSYEETLKACERSLKQLKTGYLDLYLLHWAGSHPLEETFRAFEQLKSDGMIRFYGVSNFDVNEMEEAVSVAGKENISCNQVLYHLKERAIEWEVMPWCLEQGIAIVGYSPFQQGKFPSTSNLKVLEQIGAKYNATSNQVALRFLTHQKNVFAIPKASKVEHVEENAGANRLQLSEDDIDTIDKVFPRGKRRSLPFL